MPNALAACMARAWCGSSFGRRPAQATALLALTSPDVPAARPPPREREPLQPLLSPGNVRRRGGEASHTPFFRAFLPANAVTPAAGEDIWRAAVWVSRPDTRHPGAESHGSGRAGVLPGSEPAQRKHPAAGALPGVNLHRGNAVQPAGWAPTAQ